MEKYQNLVEEYKNKIDNANNIIVMAHINPDGDAIGSCLALKNILENEGKNVVVCLNDIPESFDILNGFEDIYSYEELKMKMDYIKKFDLAIILDLSEKDRLDTRIEYLEKSIDSILIDHHVGGSQFCNLNIIDSESPATCQIIYEIYETLGEINKVLKYEVMLPLITGIITDTGGFRFINTNVKTLEIAIEAKKLGINFDYIYSEVIFKKSISQFKLEQEAIKNLKFYSEDKIAITYLNNEIEGYSERKPGEISGIVNMAKNIDTVEISVFLNEVENESYKVSMRSKEKDISKIAKYFAGGGHVLAAGCTIKGSLEEVTDKLLEKLNEII